MKLGVLTILVAAVFAVATVAQAAAPDCSGVDPTASQPMTAPVTVSSADHCSPVMSHGKPLPDQRCTPGAINPTVTITVLRNPDFRTSCVRDQASSSTEKQSTYRAYEITKPVPNSGANMVCELDHVISLELGGADTVDNIWPQCGPANVPRNNRYFHQKDVVENYLADQVERGKIDLEAAQRAITSDWTQYISAANKWHKGHPQKRETDK